MDLQRFQAGKSRGPLFVQLADFIRASIDVGVLRPGDQLPTERMFTAQLGIARGTVRQAFGLLAQEGILVSKQGSGSYVSDVPGHKEAWGRGSAAGAIKSAIEVMAELGMTPGEMEGLFHHYLTAAYTATDRTVSLAIVGASQETLMDLKWQLAYLERVNTSVFILESITTAPDPQRLLGRYDLVLVPGSCYRTVAELLGEAHGKLIEITAPASRETLRQIFALDREARIGIICRSNEFLAKVKGTLVSHGFYPDNIQSFFEGDYTTATYFPGGIHALITFSAAHVFQSARFQYRNEELIKKGGTIIRFVSHLDRASVVEVETRVRALLEEN